MTHDEWFARYPDLGKTPVFTLRVRLSGKPGFHTIRAFEGPFVEPNHHRLYCELRYDGRVIFPRESFYVGVPGGHSLDSDYTKELVMSLFAMKPGDTDDEFFEHYTPEQLAWVEAHGEELSCEALDRYGEA